ncbi:MAG: hypothetical protein IH881_18110 [Myxococcales bacterium]|nr:hypothetical protein [Myxococcales bacterium]
MLAREVEDAHQRGVVGAGPFTGREVRQVVVSRHHLANAEEDAGKFLHPLGDHVDGAEIGSVEARHTDEEPIELLRSLLAARALVVLNREGDVVVGVARADDA